MQVDLAREARHLWQFNYNFRHSRHVTFPYPVYPLVSDEVLVETFEARPVVRLTLILMLLVYATARWSPPRCWWRPLRRALPASDPAPDPARVHMTSCLWQAALQDMARWLEGFHELCQWHAAELFVQIQVIWFLLQCAVLLQIRVVCFIMAWCCTGGRGHLALCGSRPQVCVQLAVRHQEAIKFAGMLVALIPGRSRRTWSPTWCGRQDCTGVLVGLCCMQAYQVDGDEGLPCRLAQLGCQTVLQTMLANRLDPDSDPKSTTSADSVRAAQAGAAGQPDDAADDARG